MRCRFVEALRSGPTIFTHAFSMALKRKRSEMQEGAESFHYSSQSSQEDSSDDVDVANALADTIEVGDEDAAFIRESIQTRNKKEGTEILKQSKKSRVKGDVGGGSFQSMGTQKPLRSIRLIAD